MIATLSMDPDEQRQRLGMALRFLGLAHTAWMEAQVGLCLVHCNAAVKALGDMYRLPQSYWDELGINLPLEIFKLTDLIQASHPRLFPSSSLGPKVEELGLDLGKDLEFPEVPEDPLSIFTVEERGRLAFMKYLVKTGKVKDTFEGK